MNCPTCGEIVPSHRRTRDGGRECVRCGRVIRDPFVAAKKSMEVGR